jgi:dextranase
MNLIRIFILLLIVLSSCKKVDEQVIDPDPESIDLIEKIETDRARYMPGESVTINLRLKSTDFEALNLKYKYLTTILKEETIIPTGNQLEIVWAPPSDDFRGYAVEFECVKEGKIVDYGSTAIDISSDWTKFPRYGFLSDFSDIPATEIESNIQDLNHYHINGLQFYDWHNKHHIPLKMNGDTPSENWVDIAGRNSLFNSVDSYIKEARKYNMASMSYNLLYGAWEDYALDGVSNEWMIYNDPAHTTINRHDLDDNWAESDILVANPANSDWQNYIFQRTDTVYLHLDFDGWHLDQLGHRGTVYDYNGNQIDLWLTFIPFLENLKVKFPEKKMVLNAVNQYGQLEILSTPVDFSYTEVWDPNESYADLAEVITNNFDFNNQINTVLAAYINYDLADSQGEFNEAAVLMADAVIMSFGGCHLELGEHMLCKEYFPNNKLSMSDELKNRLIEYYDFMVAYQNILRDGAEIEINTGITSSDIAIGSWNPVLGKVSTFKREMGDITTYHFINFDGLNSLEWRDNRGILSKPSDKTDFEISLPTDQVNSVVYTSPDWHEGVQIELDYTISNGRCTIEIPYLEYCGMLIIE